MMIIIGKVIHGAQLGRRMGFPTANLDATEIKGADNGVYCSRAVIDGKIYGAMTNLGCRPSVDGQSRLLETHIFDFHGDIYGKTIEVRLLSKIRDEKRFDSIEELRRQLERDADMCRAALEDKTTRHESFGSMVRRACASLRTIGKQKRP